MARPEPRSFFASGHELDRCNVCGDNRRVDKSPFGRIKTKEKIFVPLVVLITTIWSLQLGWSQEQKSTADELVEAAAFNWPEKLELLVNNHADVNAPGFDGRTALAAAANRGDAKMVEFLLKHKADPNARNKDGMTPIIMARSVEVIKLLLASGADINATDSQNTIFWQFLNNHFEQDETGRLQLLLANGVDVTVGADGLVNFVLSSDDLKDVDLLVPYYINYPKPAGRLRLEGALGAARDCNRSKMVFAIVSAAIRIESHPLHKAAATGDDATVRSLLVAHPDSINEKGVIGWTALHIAALTDQPIVAETLLRNHADPDALDDVGNTPLSWAVFFGHGKMVEVLLRNKANKEITGRADRNFYDGGRNTPLDFAIERGFTSIAEMLIADGANLNTNPNKIGACAGATPIHVAASLGNADVIKLLLAHGADVNARERWPQTSPFGTSALDLAVAGDSPESVRLLIANGASLEAEMSGGDTLFHLWAEKGNPAIADQLLAAGCDINAKNDDGKTPLHLAIFLWHQWQPTTQAIQWLLDHKAETNTKDKDGETPLHLAANFSGAEVVRLLLDHNADVNALDKEGKTPLMALRDYAWQFRDNITPLDYDAVVKLLLAHGAKDSAAYSLGSQNYLLITPDLTKTQSAPAVPFTVKNVSNQDIIVDINNVVVYLYGNVRFNEARARYAVSRYLKISEPILKPGESIHDDWHAVNQTFYALTGYEMPRERYKPGDKIIYMIGGRISGTDKIFECYSAPFELPPLPQSKPPSKWK